MTFLFSPDTRILVVAAHADDEVLGAGGTLYSAIRTGASVHVLIMSTGSLSRDIDEANRATLKERRIHSATAVATTMGWTLSLCDFPDNAFDTIRSLDITKSIEATIIDFKPDVIMTHYPGDISRDHQIVSSSVVAASRPTGDDVNTPAILYFEVASSTNWNFGIPENKFQPNFWVKLDDDSLQSKLKAIQEYSDELREWPHPRSIESLTVQAKYRGAEIGEKISEAFIIARQVAVFNE